MLMKMVCPWKFTICFRTIENGHLDCLKYAYENGCKLYKNKTEACLIAIKYGHLDCLKYLHEIGC